VYACQQGSTEQRESGKFVMSGGGTEEHMRVQYQGLSAERDSNCSQVSRPIVPKAAKQVSPLHGFTWGYLGYLLWVLCIVHARLLAVAVQTLSLQLAQASAQGTTCGLQGECVCVCVRVSECTLCLSCRMQVRCLLPSKSYGMKMGT
jgi:hypothetical protein